MKRGNSDQEKPHPGIVPNGVGEQRREAVVNLWIKSRMQAASSGAIVGCAWF